MKFRIPHGTGKWLALGVAAVVVVTAAMTYGRWLPPARQAIHQVLAGIGSEADRATSPQAQANDSHNDHDHDDHDHGEGHEHDEEAALHLSPAALRNLGLTPEYIKPVRLSTYRRSITVPALVVERAGRTHMEVATPMTGVITHVHVVPGEAVAPGTLLFQIRLTHEDLVTAQTQFLQTLGELDVERREIARLQDVTRSGAVAGKVLLEREYERDKLEAMASAQREALRLHGLSDEQVDRIAEERRLLRELLIVAPSPDDHGGEQIRLTDRDLQPIAFGEVDLQPRAAGETVPLVVSDLRIHKGQTVTAGQTLCVLADYSQLYIEGLAFEQDVDAIAASAEQGWTVTALLERSNRQVHSVEGLEIVRLSNEIDIDSRTLRFYVRLPNQIINTASDVSNQPRYVQWQYRPGQRLQLRVPVEEWKNQIVLPVHAVAREGAEFYVFESHGDHFERVEVHVKYRDQHSVVIANDGALRSGNVVALRGAHQMHIALKNKAGGGIDPHQGHSH